MSKIIGWADAVSSVPEPEKEPAVSQKNELPAVSSSAKGVASWGEADNSAEAAPATEGIPAQENKANGKVYIPFSGPNPMMEAYESSLDEGVAAIEDADEAFDANDSFGGEAIAIIEDAEIVEVDPEDEGCAISPRQEAIADAIRNLVLYRDNLWEKYDIHSADLDQLWFEIDFAQREGNLDYYELEHAAFEVKKRFLAEVKSKRSPEKWKSPNLDSLIARLKEALYASLKDES